ncbi:MAG: metallophosphoesterase [Deltaproteobacteria bacterium]|nr:metallophosphoesterase [Deltaproteobacteria bacterium]
MTAEPRAFLPAPEGCAPGERFALVADLQRTSWLEFWREQNDPERAQIVAAIARERPAFVVMVGDLVFDGSSAAEWEAFDRLCEPLREIPCYGALGNHEFWSLGDHLGRFFARYPHQRPHRWSALKRGPLWVVLLDSNPGAMTKALWEAQEQWFRQTLADADGAPSVRGVLVLVHHPPFTNSAVTGDSRAVQRAFLPAFFGARKTLAMVSGHAHTLERFERQGRAFLVCGGGGGPRHRLLQGVRRRHPDDLVKGPALRDFHYVLGAVTDEGLTLRVLGLPKGATAFYPLDAASLPWHAG